MPTYDNPNVIRHQFPSHDFGAGAFAGSLKGPAGHKGRILDLGLSNITETFTNVTTGAYLRVGTGADPDAYAQMDCAAAAATDTYNTQDDTDAIIDEDLPADTQIEVTGVAPTGGTPAGIASFYVDVAWFK